MQIQSFIKPEIRNGLYEIPLSNWFVEYVTDDESLAPSATNVYVRNKESQCKPLSQNDLNDQIRDLELTKNKAEIKITMNSD